MIYYQSPRKRKSILAQKLTVFAQKKVRWITILSSFPLFGMVTAFGIVPDSSFQEIPNKKIVRALPLPEEFASSDPEMTFWHQESIRRGDTISAILARLEISQKDKNRFLDTVRGSRAMSQLKPGEIIHAETRPNGELLALRYFYGNGEQFQVEKIDGTFELNEQSAEGDTRVLVGSGVISSSLFAAVDKADLPSTIASQMIDIFSSSIDFHRDVRKGDRFTVVYESAQDESGKTQVGRVLAVEFFNKEKSRRAVYFRPPGEEGGYYTPEGESLSKPFLMAPLKFSRISSGFTHARYHPILKRWRAHRGIDYAAPTGTPVMATANGTVEFKGKQSGYGNLIILKHDAQYSSAYGHLSGFNRKLQKGMRVKQGDIIGFVGSTGMATGPHLHYELRVNGVQRDPSKIVMPAAQPVSKKYYSAFHRQTRELASRLDLLRNTSFAALN
ncbi:Murein DD-endopeptidase MepM and murein hydrolase activator NlpD, contain LysM domain [Nitrosomonas eutropha]|uniref:M23 family metallopeptidase n=1 Tax=Nitrosomonas eutropha TaxID=916 RepID=UPI00088C5B94|nr:MULTISPECIES: peptidoglycan DD-metalloendopeptidase family protein [Nitrosomonas]MXS80285.1 M23 family peptidase [Nitrosomonas sp. GH22]SCX00178.1 Murein DD-endopeptidase MepM and murein hydrolase activator NlpD, contain LysM domain [Nitrosomonas eutropha]SDW32030.1 Murein DD-endopeptidase MepM and murein hydrolase activator NlpD, contain LysM domain [Nitrosomonas eutropha]